MEMAQPENREGHSRLAGFLSTNCAFAQLISVKEGHIFYHSPRMFFLKNPLSYNHRRVVVAGSLEINKRSAVAGGPETVFFKTS
jgi:hypothetical protein